MRRRIVSILILVIGFGLSLLAERVFPSRFEQSREAIQSKRSSPVAFLREDTEIGQSFVAGTDNLVAVSFYISIVNKEELHNPIVFRLYQQGSLSQPLVVKEIELADAVSPSWLSISFNQIPDTRDHCYTFTLQNKSKIPNTSIALFGTYWNSYPDGQLVVNHSEQNGDLAFMTYSQSALNRSLQRGIATLLDHTTPLMSLFAIIVVSSTTIFWLVFPVDDNALALTIAASVVGSPLLASILILGIDWSGIEFLPYILIPIMLLLGARTWFAAKVTLSIKRIFNRHTLSLVGVLCFILLTQLGFIKDTPLPLYADSVHHTLISREVVRTLELPTQLPIDGMNEPFVYHLGVHALTASITLLSNHNVPPEIALLIEGPILLVLFSLGIYCLARILGCNHWCGLSGMILSSFAFSMPSYLLNWGKYPLLLALSTFCGVLVLFILSMKDKAGLDTRLIVGLLVASNILAHTRMLVIWLAVYLFSTFVLFLQKWHCKEVFRRVFPCCVGPLGIVGLWLFPRWLNWASAQGQPVLSQAFYEITRPSYFQKVIYDFKDVEFVWIALLIIGFLAMGQKDLQARLFIILCILTLTALSLVPISQVPGERLLDAQFTHAALTIPLIVGLGIIVNSSQQILKRLYATPLWVVPVAVSFIAVFGLVGRRDTPDLECQLASKYDIEAMEWIEEAIPPSSVVGIATAQWQDGQVVGVDGGYWISTLTGRRTSLPPLLYGFSPPYIQAEVIQYAIDVNKTVQIQGNLCELGVDYVYVGRSSMSFDRPILEANPHLELVYDSGSTAVFRAKGCGK